MLVNNNKKQKAKKKQKKRENYLDLVHHVVGR